MWILSLSLTEDSASTLGLTQAFDAIQRLLPASVVVLVQKLRNRRIQGERVPAIHTVGFFADEQRGGPGERFLRQLSALTGGTFQVAFASTTLLKVMRMNCESCFCQSTTGA